MSYTGGNQAQPGWYPDPQIPGTERFYDGTVWTTQTRPTGAGGFVPAPPQQAEPGAKKSRRGWWIAGGVVAGLFLLGGIGAAIGGGGDEGDDSAAKPTTEATVEAVVEEEPVATVAVPELVGLTSADASAQLVAAGLVPSADGEVDAAVLATDPVAGTQVEAGSTVTLTLEEKPALTLAQQNAVDSAQRYLDFAGFSRTGLIGQLEFEGFATEDATWAVDYLAPDWNAEAAESAQNYLDFTSFSRQGLIDQLVFEGYTPAEAEAGVTAVGY